MAIVHQSFATGAANSATCTKPTGTSTGDVLVALVLSTSSAASLTGWTVQTNTNLASILFLTILTRVVDGTEGSSFTFTATSVAQVGISRYSGVDTTTPVEGTPTQSVTSSSLTTTAASVTTVTAGAVLVHGVGWSSGSGTPASTPPGTMTEEWEVVSGSPALVALNDETRASAGATGTRTSTITGASGGHTHAVLIALKPGATATNVTIPASMAETWAMGTPAILAGSKVLPAAMGVTWAMGVPTIKATSTVVVPNPMAETWAMGVPSISTGYAVPVPASMGVTWAMGVPTIRATSTVAIPSPMSETWAMGTPTPHTNYGIPVPSMGVDWQMGVPTISASSRVVVPSAMPETWAMGVPSLAYGATAQIPLPMGMQWAMGIPTIQASSRVVIPDAMDTDWEMGVPFVGVAKHALPWAGGQMQPQSQTGVRGSVNARAGVTGTVRARPGVTMKETP